jgi:hypothetical protein
MAFYFYETIINEPVELSLLIAVFLTLFLFFFFCFNMRQAPVEKPEPLADLDEEEPVIQDYIPELSSPNDHKLDQVYEEPEELEELEAAEPELGSEIPEQKPVFVNPSPASDIRLAFGDDDIPYLVESSGLELVDGDLGEIVSFIQEADSIGSTDSTGSTDSADPAESEEPEELLEAFVEEAEPEVLLDTVSVEDVVLAESEMVAFDNAEVSYDVVEAAELEDISTSFGSITIFGQPFSCSLSNPELLYGAGNQVIYEQNGIHFINTHFDGEGIDKMLDNNFAKLVESVLTAAPRN